MAINVEDVGQEGPWEPNFKPDCTDVSHAGSASARYDYIQKSIHREGEYPDEACTPYYHSAAQIDLIKVNTSMTGAGAISITGDITTTTSVTAPTFNGTATGNKVIAAFDIPHVTQEGKRIRHVIAEGPEAGIYIRGTLKDSNKIELPEYWDGLVDPETITVTLTQIGYSQDLIVDGVEWGKTIKVKSGNGANINCYYEVWVARYINPLDHDEKLHVVYEGDSPENYPGNNEHYLIGGWDYDRRETNWRRPEDTMDSVNLDKDS